MSSFLKASSRHPAPEPKICHSLESFLNEKSLFGIELPALLQLLPRVMPYST